MVKNFLEYRFNTDTVSYPTSYNPNKLNLGYLMKKSVDGYNKTYVSPLEPVFIRGFEVNGNLSITSMFATKWSSNIIWLFYVSGNQVNASKRFYLAEYNFSTNSITEIGSININLVDNTYNSGYSLISSLERHTGGTVSVSYSAVTGFGTQWVNNGVCAGNRIGFGSTDATQITTWYEVLSVNSNTSLSIKRGVITDGNVTPSLSFTPGTSYVIEDLRLMYANYGGNNTNQRGIALTKGLRKEIFNSSVTSIPAATTIDNQRASYRIVDGTVIGATFSPFALVLDDKISLSEQYAYSDSYASTTLSLQKFNIRAPLTGLVSSRTNSPYLFTTASVAHGGTDTGGYTPMVINTNTKDIYVTHSTRVSRIPMSAVTASSASFIANQMLEVPPGGTNTFAVTNALNTSHFLPIINRLYINTTSGLRSYITPYSGGSNNFERVLHINDRIQQTSYLDFSFDYLTPHTIGSSFYSCYSSGISFLVRQTSDSNNLIYALPLEADKDYESLTNACVITPKLTTLSAVTYDSVYFDTINTWSNNKFTYPREIFDAYYRISGINDNTGSWRFISQNGSMSGITSSEIQFKFTFRTIGNYCVPTRIEGITLTYSANTQPVSTSFYEPSLKNSNISSNIFSWRQRDNFESNIPNLNLDIYDVSNNNLLLTDSVNSSSNGIWQYSTDGVTWSSWLSSANSIGNYIRYSATTLSASGIKVKPILYT